MEQVSPQVPKPMAPPMATAPAPKPEATAKPKKNGRDPQVELLIKKKREAAIEAAMKDADQFIAEMMDNPLQPRCVETKETFLIEALKRKGLKVKPQWNESQDDNGKTTRKATGMADVIIPDR